VAKLAYHDVERHVGIRQVLGITFGPDDLLRLGDARILTGLIEQFGSQIQTGHSRANARRSDGYYAGTSPHIEHILPRSDSSELHEVPGHGCREHSGWSE